MSTALRRRPIIGQACRVWAAATSRGSGYEPHPPGSNVQVGKVLGYYLDYRRKTQAPAADEVERLLPVALAQVALGWWERMVDGEPEALIPFDRACAAIVRRAEPSSDGARWVYDIPVPKYGLRPGWCSAMAQGQIASVLVRAYLASGDPARAQLACDAVSPLARTSASDLVTLTGAGPVLEEYPSMPPSHVLNGWVYALWGLLDVHLVLDHGPAGRGFDEGIACLRRMLGAYDTGWWTRYSLFPLPLGDLAKPLYHRVHIDQQRVLHRLTGFAEFDEAARRWSSYDRPAHAS